MELISQKTIDLLQKRIKAEEESSRLYEQFSLWLKNESFISLAKLFSKYASEEMNHAGWAKDYLLSFNVMPELPSLEEPMNLITTLTDIADKTLEHESKITMECRELYKHALEEGDFNLITLAHKYNVEQVEELDKINSLRTIIKMSSDKLSLDHYVADNLL
jgi:ferritin